MFPHSLMGRSKKYIYFGFLRVQVKGYWYEPLASLDEIQWIMVLWPLPSESQGRGFKRSQVQ